MNRASTATLRSSPHLQIAALTLILLMAAALRIPNIDGPALWTDEGFTYYTFKVPLFEAIQGDRHPPFYFYTLHAWVAAAGDSVLALRWWSMLPSMLTVAVAAALGRELARWRPDVPGAHGWLGLPVVAALLMALAAGERYLAQELRMYTWHVLFAAVSSLGYLRYARMPTNRRAAVWIVGSLLLIYTHYFGAFVLAVQGLHALVFLHGRARLRAIGALALTGLLFLPWLLGVTLDQFAQEEVCVNCAAPANWGILLDFRLKWFGQQWPLMLVLFTLGLVTVHHRGDGFSLRLRPVAPPALLVLLILLPIAGTYTLGHNELIFFAHRLVQITVPVILLMALGLGNLQAIPRVLVAAAITLYGVTTIDWYRVKVPWDLMAERIATYALPGDLALANVDYEESALLYYYDHLLPDGVLISTYPVWSDMDRAAYYDGELPALLAQTATNTNGIATAWITHFSVDTVLFERLEGLGYTRTMTWTYDHVGSAVDVLRYDALPDEPLATFGPGMTLRAATILPDVLRVDLWWQADAPLEQNYIVSAFVLDESGRLVAQLDLPPFWGERPAKTWNPGDVIYDPRPLALVGGLDALPPGTYTAAVQVYYFGPEGEIVPVTRSNGERILILDPFVR